MADGAWSQSGCSGPVYESRPDVWWYGIPGQGCWYWTAVYGQWFVTGSIYANFASGGWECGNAGPPVGPMIRCRNNPLSRYQQDFEGGKFWTDSTGTVAHYAHGNHNVCAGAAASPPRDPTDEETVDDSDFLATVIARPEPPPLDGRSRLVGDGTVPTTQVTIGDLIETR